MTQVVITFKIMPTSPEVDLDEIEAKAKEEIKAFCDTEQFKTEIEPVAFGLKAINLLFAMDEAKGSTDELENKIKEIEGVNSVEVVDVRRAVG
tara:strand:- start:3907 stop:4185 length:279 start_codon:yes stop_codon:yes gene_type:complete